MRKLIAVVSALCFMAPSVHASLIDWDWLTQYKKPNMHYGQLAIHPFYQIATVYDSNIYLVPHDLPSGQVGGGVRGSWITKNTLGVDANLPWHNTNNLNLGYQAEADSYSTQPDINDTINQSAHADYTHVTGGGLTYKVGDEYVNTTDQAFSELIQRQRRWMNNVYAGVDYRPKNGRLAGGVDVSHETDKYLDPTLASGLNRYEERAGFNVGYMVQPKTKAFVAYHRGIIHYTVNPVAPAVDKNSKSHTVTAGVDGELTPKISGQVEAGATYREYDAAPVSGAPRVNRSPVVSTSLLYKPDPYTNISLTLSRILQESVDPNNPFYYSNNAMLDMDHKFPHKFTAGLNFALGKDQYLNDQNFGGTRAYRRDDLYQGGVWVEYDIQAWLSTGLSYVYRERNSTMTGQFNYQDSQTSWNAALKF